MGEEECTGLGNAWERGRQDRSPVDLVKSCFSFFIFFAPLLSSPNLCFLHLPLICLQKPFPWSFLIFLPICLGIWHCKWHKFWVKAQLSPFPSGLHFPSPKAKHGKAFKNRGYFGAISQEEKPKIQWILKVLGLEICVLNVPDASSPLSHNILSDYPFSLHQGGANHEVHIVN